MKTSKVKCLYNLRGFWQVALKTGSTHRNFSFIPAVVSLSKSDSGTSRIPINISKDQKSSTKSQRSNANVSAETSKAPAHTASTAPKPKPLKSIPYKTLKKKSWPGVDERFSEDYKTIMKSRDFDAAMTLYASIKDLNTSSRTDVLTGLLLICTKRHHLSSALELFDELSELVSQPSETAYMSLIRCYSDNGQIDIALSLIDRMKKELVELKLRNYHPILEAAVGLRDFKNSILTIKKMIAESLSPRSDHFILLLQAAAASGSFHRSSDVDQIDRLLNENLVDLSDMTHEGLMRIIAALSNVTEEEADSRGILLPSDKNVASEESEAERRKKPLKLVHICSKTSCCPNCNGQLRPLYLSTSDRETVRQGLLSMTTTQFAVHHSRNMKVTECNWYYSVSHTQHDRLHAFLRSSYLIYPPNSI